MSAHREKLRRLACVVAEDQAVEYVAHSACAIDDHHRPVAVRGVEQRRSGAGAATVRQASLPRSLKEVARSVEVELHDAVLGRVVQSASRFSGRLDGRCVGARGVRDLGAAEDTGKIPLHRHGVDRGLLSLVRQSGPLPRAAAIVRGTGIERKSLIGRVRVLARLRVAAGAASTRSSGASGGAAASRLRSLASASGSGSEVEASPHTISRASDGKSQRRVIAHSNRSPVPSCDRSCGSEEKSLRRHPGRPSAVRGVQASFRVAGLASGWPRAASSVGSIPRFLHV